MNKKKPHAHNHANTHRHNYFHTHNQVNTHILTHMCTQSCKRAVMFLRIGSFVCIVCNCLCTKSTHCVLLSKRCAEWHDFPADSKRNTHTHRDFHTATTKHPHTHAHIYTHIHTHTMNPLQEFHTCITVIIFLHTVHAVLSLYVSGNSPSRPRDMVPSHAPSLSQSRSVTSWHHTSEVTTSFQEPR